jgi:hypothetical protein
MSLSETVPASVSLTALEGMGGIGKAILAEALCHGEVTQEAFPDGVICIGAGKGSTYDLRTRIRPDTGSGEGLW